MKKKLLIGGAVAAALLSGGGIAAADPGPPQPGPDTPMCWEPTSDGWMHTQYVPCGWTYSAADGWQQLPPPPP